MTDSKGIINYSASSTCRRLPSRQRRLLIIYSSCLVDAWRCHCHLRYRRIQCSAFSFIPLQITGFCGSPETATEAAAPRVTEWMIYYHLSRRTQILPLWFPCKVVGFCLDTIKVLDFTVYLLVGVSRPSLLSSVVLLSLLLNIGKCHWGFGIPSLIFSLEFLDSFETTEKFRCHSCKFWWLIIFLTCGSFVSEHCITKKLTYPTSFLFFMCF